MFTNHSYLYVQLTIVVGRVARFLHLVPILLVDLSIYYVYLYVNAYCIDVHIHEYALHFVLKYKNCYHFF